MPRSMKDFIDARQPAVDGNVRVNVPIFLPGYSVLGKFGAGDPTVRFSGLLATIYSVPAQAYRVTMRTVNRLLKPAQPVYEQASLRNMEIVITDTEILYAPTSPLLLKAYPPRGREAISGTSLRFETVTGGQMSKLMVGTNLWNVHPEYAGDVRWGLRRLADDFPEYDISFGGEELPEPSADEVEHVNPENEEE